MRRRTFFAPALLALLLLVAVLLVASATPQAATAATKKVRISNFTFAPQVITIKHGTKVVWKNADSAVHNVTSANKMSTSATATGLFASPTLSKGASYSRTFKKKGTFFYMCTFHAGMATMHGKIVVK